MGLERNQASLDYVFDVKSFGWLGKILSYCFQYNAKNDNLEFSLLSMVPHVKVKFQVIVFGHRAKIDNSELLLPSNSMCHRKIPTYRFCPVHKSNNSGFT